MNINSRILIFLQKRLYAILFCWVIALYALYFYLLRGLPFFYESSFTPLLFFAVGLAAFYALLLRVMKYQTEKINKIYTDDCDPQTFTAVCRDMLSKFSGMKRRINLSFVKINICAGLLGLGEYQEALQIMSGITLNTETKTGKIIATVYHNNICSVYIELGDLEKAMHHISEMQKALAGLKENNRIKKIFDVRCRVLQARIKMAEGNYDNAESVFTWAFDRMASENGRVGIKYTLGEVYLHNGDKERAREAFEYVVAHGNKLHIVEEAKKYLQQIAE